MMKGCNITDSFANAFRGMRRLLGDRNMVIHALSGVAAVAMGFCLEISAGEWIAVILAIAIVTGAEALNTAIEILSDRVCGDYDEQIKLVKDVAAAGVLITAIAASIVGGVIFLPKIISLS